MAIQFLPILYAVGKAALIAFGVGSAVSQPSCTDELPVTNRKNGSSDKPDAGDSDASYMDASSPDAGPFQCNGDSYSCDAGDGGGPIDSGPPKDAGDGDAGPDDAGPAEDAGPAKDAGDWCSTMTCPPEDDCNYAGRCNPVAQRCMPREPKLGRSCEDGNICTMGETCQPVDPNDLGRGAACKGGSVVTCPPPPATPQYQCKTTASCDPVGGCSSEYANKANGSGCNDNNNCTTGESCQDGVCSGGSIVTCSPPPATPQYQCKTTASCDPVGGCSLEYANKINGSGCNDNNNCTTGESCRNGVCDDGSAVTCPTPPATPEYQCKTARTCEPASGCAVGYANKPDNLTCDDGEINTNPDTCQTGGCRGEQIAGVNYHVARLTGPIVDLDPTLDGAILAFGGVPIALVGCQPNVVALDDATCSVKALFRKPLDRQQEVFDPDMRPVGFSLFSGAAPIGFGFAQTSPDLVPIGLARINMNAVSPQDAVEGYESITNWTIRSGSDPMIWIISGVGNVVGLEVPQPAPAHPRYFMSTSNGGWPGFALSWSEEHGSLFHRGMLGLPPLTAGVNQSSSALTDLIISGASKKAYVSLDAGSIDPTDGSVAAINIYDAYSPEVTRLRTIELSEISAAPLSELKLDATGKVAYVPLTTASGEVRLAVVNLETVPDNVAYIPLNSAVVGAVTDMVVKNDKAYISDDSGRITFVNLSTRIVEGYHVLPAGFGSPQTMEMAGAMLFVAGLRSGNPEALLGAIDPSTVSLLH